MIRQPVVLAQIFLLLILNPHSAAQDAAIRVMTFNIEDVRHSEIDSLDAESGKTGAHDRLSEIAEVIQRIRPSILLLNEIETRQNPDIPSTAEGFIENYLMISQAEGVDPIEFNSYTPATNTGIHSGMDLDNSGSISDSIPERTLKQSADQRTYGGDSFGFGGFPGQYGMALLVHPDLEILEDQIRTFQFFLWKDLPDAQAPLNPDGSPFYSRQAWDIFRLSSKTFADVPIRLPGGAVIHALISHPTPPAFDGPEQRNKHRNRDEIRLIRAYIDNNPSLYDDSGIPGGLSSGASFVILGDLNADPIDGSSIGDPINSLLLESDLVALDSKPSSETNVQRLDPTDTSMFRLRVDYVLPSANLKVLDAGVWRYGVHDKNGFPSDHFPVWMDLIVPSP